MKISEEALKTLIKQAGFTHDSFAEKLGLTRQGLYYLINKKDVPEDELKNISKVLKTEIEYFTTNVSEPFVKYNSRGNIIYVPLVAYGGFLHGYSNKVFVDSLERFSLPGITGEHYAFEVDGMSMWDKAGPGDKAIARLEEKLEWMVKGKMYVLQTIDGLLIKLFDRIAGEKAYFHSYNKEYDGLELPLKSLKRVYFVNHILKKQ